jgi:hypothetical protein
MIRVEVATHFNEDSFSYGLAHGMADRLRRELQGVSCPTHADAGVVRVSTDGVAQAVNDLHIEVSGCCADVSAEVGRVVDQVREAEIADN